MKNERKPKATQVILALLEGQVSIKAGARPCRSNMAKEKKAGASAIMYNLGRLLGGPSSCHKILKGDLLEHY